MTLGEKLRQARVEAGLSQRQLCGEQITRNMLSQIEHGTARPSMDTMEYLAKRLGKSVGYFLDEESVAMPNLTVIRRARECYGQGDMEQICRVLEDYRGPDEIFDREKALLLGLSCLALAEAAVEQGRKLYALELLERAWPEICAGYCAEELKRRYWLLLGRAGSEEAVSELPDLDAELLLRARWALERDPRRCGALLDAMEKPEPAAWALRGRVYMAGGAYAEAAECFGRAGDSAEVFAQLEICYRELGDYQKAYEYACKQRKMQENS